jgi:superfamily II DNA or RNA helicase
VDVLLTAARATEADLDCVRHDIASAILSGAGEIDPRLGSVVLRPQQRAAARRLVGLIAAHGGAMLAEPVGVGKTYTALAVAAALGKQTLLVVPAALRAMWTESAECCGVTARVVSHEELSRGTRPVDVSDFIIVDEAHRLRSPTARRYAVLADLCRTSKVLLVTATPVQNARSDLAVQLALFLGRGVWQMSDEELAAYVVRDRATRDDGRPALSGPHLVELEVHDDCLDEMLALPPPIPARDESVVTALLTYSLVHQWTSSRAALERALQRRRARGLALAGAIEAGRQPTRAELSAWTYSGDTMQLAFPEIVADQILDVDTDTSALRESLERYRAAVELLLSRLRATPDPDDARAAALRQIRAVHPGERIIAFCHYTETVNTLRSKLRRDGGVAALTAQGARVAGGRVTRDDVLAQFTVRAIESREVPPAGRIDLLITTDLLSEGLNLQEASVIVHLDLPWNPARLDQRVGRALRLGSRHPTVTVYTFVPPASAERLMRIERRLRDKLSVAQRTIGVAGRILPSPLGIPPRSLSADPGLAEQASAVNDALRRWIHPGFATARTTAVSIAAAESSRYGFLALVRDGDDVRLAADFGGGIGIDTSITALFNAIVACSGPPIAVDSARTSRALDQLSAWLVSRAGESLVDFRAAASARARRSALQRVGQLLARAPRHQRAVFAPLADAVRAVATANLGEGAERILASLVHAQIPDEAWLRSIATFGTLNVRDPAQGSARARGSAAGTIVAIILFGPGTSTL